MNKRNKKKNLQRDAVRPNKLLGQNFLIDKNILKKIIAVANLTNDDTVLEVGPGTGFLTEELIKYAGKVIAIEKDKSLAASLKAKLVNVKNVEIIEGDVLELLKNPPQPSPASSAGQALKGGSKNSSPPLGVVKGDLLPNGYKVVANIPYYLTSHLIRLLLESANPPQEMILMIQKEVAQRICARPPKMTLLSVATQFYAQPEIIAPVSKNSFWPAPKVDSAIIKLTPYQKFSSQIAPELFFKIIRAGFAHPRKQLLGNLSGGLATEKEKIKTALDNLGLKNTQRAETLKMDDWINLARIISNLK